MSSSHSLNRGISMGMQCRDSDPSLSYSMQADALPSELRRTPLSYAAPRTTLSSGTLRCTGTRRIHLASAIVDTENLLEAQ